MMKPDLSALIKAGGDSRYVDQKAWPMYGGGNLDRKAYVTASECGKCARMIKFGKRPVRQGKGGITIPNWGFFERGHNVEAWTEGVLQDGLNAIGGGYRLLYSGENQMSFCVDEQSCTPDGLIFTPDCNWWYLEIKSFDPRISRAKLPMAMHKDQIIQGMDVVNANMDAEVIGGSLVYVNASNYNDYVVFDYLAHEHHERMDFLQARAKEILTAKKPDDLPPEGMFEDDGCKYCDFTAECSKIVEKHRERGASQSSASLIGGVDTLLEEARKATENVVGKP